MIDPYIDRRSEILLCSRASGATNKEINFITGMENVAHLSGRELRKRYESNKERIHQLEIEVEVIESKLTCHCHGCLRPPPSLSTPIRADICTFGFDSCPELQCSFDVILMDPPWQLAGQQPTRGVALAYRQLADRDIEALPIPLLSTTGLLFIWTINAKFATALKLMRKWGYRYVQDVAWVKRTVNRRLAKCHGYYLQHAKETCLVGFKGGGGGDSVPEHWQLGQGSDVIYTERRGQSQKPQELYEMIERIIPGGRYLEVFGRRHNLRDNWTTIGNEL